MTRPARFLRMTCVAPQAGLTHRLMCTVVAAAHRDSPVRPVVSQPVETRANQMSSPSGARAACSGMSMLGGGSCA